MSHRKIFLFVLLVAATAAAFAQNRVRRDWQKLPAVVQLDTSEDIFAIGDIHSDYDRVVDLLVGAKIIAGRPTSPEKVSWSAGKSVVVFTGDFIDKGPNALGVIALLSALRPAAAQAGGHVIVTMGNHEAEFLSRKETDKAKDFHAEIKRAGLADKDMTECRADAGQFLCSLPFAARVNDWFFSHAGNSGGRTLSQLTEDLQRGIDKDGFDTPELLDPNSLVLARLGAEGPGGKSWFEAGSPRYTAEQLLSAYASALKVAHIVEGHAPSAAQFPDGTNREAGQMFQWHGLLFLIDTGLSRGVDYSNGAVLHIQTAKGEASAICANGTVTPLWDKVQKPTIGRALPCR